MRSRRLINSIILAVWILCAWYFLGTPFLRSGDLSQESGGFNLPWRYEAKEKDQKQDVFEPGHTQGHENEEKSPESGEGATFSSIEVLDVSTTQSVPASPTASLPDRVVVIAKLPTDNTGWVSIDLPDWQSAIYAIDIDNPHNTSMLDPLTNSTLRTLRNKGMEANAYLAYIVQNYDNLPSTIAFIHPHKDGYPEAWHTDNHEYSNVVSLQTLNIDFVQRNGYANLRCVSDPGCPHEVMPFRDPPEAHRTIEAAMPEAWRDLFNNTNVPQILATPCCAQFAVSRDQVRKRPLEEYRKYYQWLMDTPLKDETSGRVFEYLWHIIYGQDAV
ncbi:hypothetical protein BDV96DRAFT_566839 [Lophiotrema nucula]|uniref:Uncharacterized protein n=1 Tax=Lophiotrema nucula TaxID=690887 RepID=A0A6A5ZLE4_9PLEO|nr:hypothetical protein BDV96DRAFT_566839 [Lophiotrema nucula]